MSEYKLQETFELQKYTKNISGLTISEIFDREIINLSFHIKNEKIIKKNFKKIFNFEFPDFRISTFLPCLNIKYLKAFETFRKLSKIGQHVANVSTILDY